MYRRCVHRLLSREVRTFLIRMFQNSSARQSSQDLNEYIELVAHQAQDPRVHNQLAEMYAHRKRWLPAIAEYQTSVAIGNSELLILLALARAYLAIGQVGMAVSNCRRILVESQNSRLMQEVRDLLAMAERVEARSLSNYNHNHYYRMKTLADHLFGLFPRSNFSVLDVGGGEGALALFVPEASYVLAEPSINGISGTALPFPERSFDVVVACHVLEHVPQAERPQFLDQLCSKARKYVLLLNPFHDPDGHVEKRLRLIVELTNAQWAREHLDLHLPTLDEVIQFAHERQYGCRTLPNGSLTTSVAMLLVEHYAALAGRRAELEKIKKLYNCHFFEWLTNPQFPTAQLVELEIGQ